MRRLYFNRELFARGVIAAFAAGVAHLFAWSALRALMTTGVVVLCDALGADAHRIDETRFSTGVMHVNVAVRCTQIHAYFLVAPLLWYRDRALAWNLGFQARICSAILGAACMRTAISVIAYEQGIPWRLGHGVICAVMEFCLLLFVVRCQPWSRPAPARVAVTVRA